METSVGVRPSQPPVLHILVPVPVVGVPLVFVPSPFHMIEINTVIYVITDCDMIYLVVLVIVGVGVVTSGLIGYQPSRSYQL